MMTLGCWCIEFLHHFYHLEAGDFVPEGGHLGVAKSLGTLCKLVNDSCPSCQLDLPWKGVLREKCTSLTVYFLLCVLFTYGTFESWSFCVLLPRPVQWHT